MVWPRGYCLRIQVIVNAFRITNQRFYPSTNPGQQNWNQEILASSAFVLGINSYFLVQRISNVGSVTMLGQHPESSM